MKDTSMMFPIVVPSNDHIYEYGLTKREFFAAMAMQALIPKMNSNMATEDGVKTMIRGCYELADALLEEGKK